MSERQSISSFNAFDAVEIFFTPRPKAEAKPRFNASSSPPKDYHNKEKLFAAEKILCTIVEG